MTSYVEIGQEGIWVKKYSFVYVSCTMDHRNFIHRLGLKTPINTKGPPLPLRNNCFNPPPSYSSLIVIAIGLLVYMLYYTSM